MSLLMRIRTTDDDDEIILSLEMIMRTTANLGLMHESVNVNSRQGEIILDLGLLGVIQNLVKQSYIWPRINPI